MKKFLLVILLLIVYQNLLISQKVSHFPILNREADPNFKLERELWLESMHRAEPDIDYKVLNEELRRYNREIINQKKQVLKENLLLKQDELTNVTIADGRLEGKWYERGSQNLAGRTHLTAVAPTGKDLYIASSGGNIWKGSLNGNDWKCLNNSFKFSDINALTILNNQKNQRILVAENKNLYYSDDDGIIWKSAKGLESLNTWGWIVRTRFSGFENNYTIYVLVEEWDYKNWYSVRNLYKSTDLGITFTKIIEFGKSIPIEMWSEENVTDQLFLIKNDSLFVLEDYKLKFLSESDDIKGLMNTRIDIKMTGGVFNGNTILYFALQQDFENKRYILKYDLSKKVFEFKGTAPVTMFMRNSFALSKINPNMLWIGNVNCYYSLDGGTNWILINDWAEYYNDMENKLHADIPGINTYKLNDNEEIVFINTDGGTYRTFGKDYKIKNISLKNLNVSQYYSIYSYVGEYGEYIYVGSQDQGFQIGNSYGNQPIDLVQDISGDYGSLSSGDNGRTLWTVYPGFAMVYKDLPVNYRKYFHQFRGQSKDRVWMPPIVAIPGNPNAAYTASGGKNGNSVLIRLEFDGNYIYDYEGKYVFDQQDPENDISAISISEIDTNYIYVSTKKGKFYYSSDAGKTWYENTKDTGPGYNYLHGSAVLTSKINLGKIWIAGSGYSNPGVYVSYDNGMNLEPLGEDIPKAFFYSLATNEDERIIFAATSVGPYVYLETTNKWYSMMSLDSPDQVYWSVNYIAELGIVRFATYGRGIWDFKISKITDIAYNTAVNKKPELEIYPNPATENVNLVLKNAISDLITIRLFDLNGNLQKELYNSYNLDNDIFINYDLKNSLGYKLNSGTFIIVYVVNGINYYQKLIVKG